MSEPSNNILFWRQLILLVSLILATFLFNEMADFKQGYAFYLSQLAKFILVLLIAKVSYSLLLHHVSLYYRKVYNKSPPHFLVRVLQFVILFCTLIAVVIFVLNKSVFSIMALGGVVSAGVALGVGPIILDAFLGLVHESESDFEVGDWLQIDEHRIGEVKSISWRRVKLETNDKTTIIIPQRKLSDGYINLSSPYRPLMQTIELTLDHTIPIDRGERLLTGIVSMVKGVHNKNCSAWALEATEGGIIYTVRYLIEDYKHWREIKHSVLEAITQQLHNYGLKLSETIGEYALSQGGKPYEEYNPLTSEQVLIKVDLFSILPNAAFKTLCKSAQKQIYNKDALIVEEGKEGRSLFVVAEGTVEVFVNEKNKITSLAHLSPGAYFGEMSLLTGNRRSASVRASTNCAVYEISRADIAPILKKDHNLVELLAKQIEARKKINMEKKGHKKHKNKKQLSEIQKLVLEIKGYFGL